MAGDPVPTGRISWRPGDWPPAQLDARLQILHERMAAAGYPVRVVSKTRTAEHQKRLYAQGRSAPGAIVTDKSGQPGDESRHQLGMAADFGFVSPRENWDLLGKTAQELGLEWGGTLWKKQERSSPDFIDRPHVQLPMRAQPSMGAHASGYTDPASVRVTEPTGAAPLPPPMPPPPETIDLPPLPPSPRVAVGGPAGRLNLSGPRSSAPVPYTVYTGAGTHPDINLPLEPPPQRVQLAPSMDPTAGTIARPDVNLPAPPPAPPRSLALPTDSLTTTTPADINDAVRRTQPRPVPPTPRLPRLDPLTTTSMADIDDAVRRTQPTATPPAAAGGTLRDYVTQMAARYKVPPELAFAIIERESKGVHATAGQVTTSEKNARGMFQVLPQTAAAYGLDADDPLQNIEAGVRNLREGLDAHDNDPVSAAAYYFAGSNPAKHGPATEEYAKAIGGRLLEMLQEKDAALQQAAQPVAAGPQMSQVPQAAPMPPPAPPPQGVVPAGATAPAADPGTTLAPGARQARPMGFGESLIQGLDPNEREGRRNIGGLIGSAVGGFAGSVVPVWGTALGAAAGAGLGGYAEQLLVEETGLGDWLAKKLPGTTDLPIPRRRAPAGETPEDRADEVGMEQAIYDIVGTLSMGALRFAGTRVMQNRVGEAAKSVFQDLKKEALDGLHADLNALKTRARELFLERMGNRQTAQTAADAATQSARAAAEAAERQAAAEGEAAVTRTELREGGKVGVADQKVADARTLAQQRMGEVRQTQRDLVAEARANVQARTLAAKQAEEAAIEASRQRFLAEQAAAPVTETRVGERAADLFEGPATESLNKMGRAVEKAADTGPAKGARQLQRPAEKALVKEIIPPTTSFPRNALPDLPVEEAAEKAAAAVGAKPPTRGRLAKREAAGQGSLLGDDAATVAAKDAAEEATESAAAKVADEAAEKAEIPATRFTKLMEDIGEERYRELVKHPAMDVIRRILNARGKVPYKDIHLWKVELDDAIRHTFDKTQRKRVAALTLHLRNELRGALTGHEAYDVATAAYRKNVRGFRQGLARTLRQITAGTAEPNTLVRKISTDRPREASWLVELLTTHAEAGGREAAEQAARKARLGKDAIKAAGDKGAADAISAGRATLDELRGQWVHRFITDGSIDTLPQRLADLRKRKEFMQAFFPDAESQAALRKLDAAVASHALTESVAKGATAAEKTAAEAAARQARITRVQTVRGQKGKGTAGISAAENVAASTKAARDAAVEEARRLAKETLTGVKDTGAATVAGVKTTNAQAKAQAKSVGRQELVDNLEAKQRKTEEIRQRTAGTQAEIDFKRSTLGRPLSGPAEATGNFLNTLFYGPRGRGWWRALAGASTADMVKYLKVIKTAETGGVTGKYSSKKLQALGKVYPLTTSALSPAAMSTLLKLTGTASSIPAHRSRRRKPTDSNAPATTALPPPKPKPAEISLTIRP